MFYGGNGGGGRRKIKGKKCNLDDGEEERKKRGIEEKNPERRLWIKSNQTISSTHTLGRGKEEDEGKA